MLANLVREFCAQSEGKYEVYENYSGRFMYGRKTIGIVVKQDQNYLFMLHELTLYIDSQGIEEPIMMQLVEEFEAVTIDELGLDKIVYFPAIRKNP